MVISLEDVDSVDELESKLHFINFLMIMDTMHLLPANIAYEYGDLFEKFEDLYEKYLFLKNLEELSAK